MRNAVLPVLVVLLLVPAAVMGQKQNPAQDKYDAFKAREYGTVPIINKIPFLKKYSYMESKYEYFEWVRPEVKVAVASPDGRYLLTGNCFGQLDLWDLESPEKNRRHFANFGPIEYEFQRDNPTIPQLCWMAFTQDGSQIAVTCNEKLFMLDTATATILRTVDLPMTSVNWGNSLFGGMPFALSPCGGFFAYDGREDGGSCLKVVNTETGNGVFKKNLAVDTWPHYDIVSKGSQISIERRYVAGRNDDLASLCFSPDGKHLLVVLRYHGAEIIDAMTGETITTLKWENLIAPDKNWNTLRGTFSPDGKYLITSGIVYDKTYDEGSNPFLSQPLFSTGKILLWDAKTFRLLREWGIEGDDQCDDEFLGPECVSVAFSQDGKQVLVGHVARRDLSRNKVLLTLTITQYDAETGQRLKATAMEKPGETPLTTEFRPLSNNQVHGEFHRLPRTFESEDSFLEKVRYSLDIRRLLPFR